MSGHPDPARRLLRRQLRADPRVTPPGHVYASPQQFVLRHGTWHIPTRTARMAARQCFSNSLHAATVYPGWTYVEGYALGPVARIPVHHAWVVDRDGHAIELTWRYLGAAYLGVPFAVERADDATWVGDATVLDDHRRGWPLLRHRWHGETGDTPRSPRLTAMAAVLPLTGIFEQAGLLTPPLDGTDPALLDRWEEAIRTAGPDATPDDLMDALLHAADLARIQ